MLRLHLLLGATITNYATNCLLGLFIAEINQGHSDFANILVQISGIVTEFQIWS